MVLIVCVQRRDAEQLYDSACIQGSEVAGWHGTRNTLFGPVRPSAIHACGAGNEHHCCEASSCFHALILCNSATCLSTSSVSLSRLRLIPISAISCSAAGSLVPNMSNISLWSREGSSSHAEGSEHGLDSLLC